MLDYIARIYDTPIEYSYTPVTLIKKKLHDTNQQSYLKKEKKGKDARYSLTLVHKGQDYDFVHHLPDDESNDRASVLIYYLQKDIPYEILYEHSKEIHTVLKTN